MVSWRLQTEISSERGLGTYKQYQYHSSLCNLVHNKIDIINNNKMSKTTTKNKHSKESKVGC